jgi:hypothetical protein
MAREYAGAEKHLVRDEDIPFERRTFMLLLLTSPLVSFDKTHADLKAVLRPQQNQEKGRYALRTQLIGDPTRPLGAGAEILQFFMVDPNHDNVLRGGQPAVIYEVTEGTGGGETPLVLLTASEVDLLAHGEGFSTPLRRA